MDRMDLYRAHLLADSASKSLLQAHTLSGYAEAGIVSFNQAEAEEKFDKLAAALGYRVEKITSPVKEAA